MVMRRHLGDRWRIWSDRFKYFIQILNRHVLSVAETSSPEHVMDSRHARARPTYLAEDDDRHKSSFIFIEYLSVGVKLSFFFIIRVM